MLMMYVSLTELRLIEFTRLVLMLEQLKVADNSDSLL